MKLLKYEYLELSEFDVDKYEKIQPDQVSAELLRQFRSDIGMNQLEFGAFAGVPSSTVASWENLHKSPSLTARVCLARLMRRSKPLVVARLNFLRAVEEVKKEYNL